MFGRGEVRGFKTLDWKPISARDAERREAVSKLLAEGGIQSADDNFFASLIFQHGDRPRDYLLAHVLSETAVVKGKTVARWMAAATLDRYLHSIGQPQVFGTQFFKNGNLWTMDPYDKVVLSDPERALWCVVPLARQDEVLAEYQKGGSSSTQIQNCK
jgi:hypothetical protein